MDPVDLPFAEAHVREALEIQQVLGRYMADALEGIAALMTALGRPAEAVPIWGRARRLRDESGTAMEVPDQRRYERQLTAARRALRDDAAFDAAWNEGRLLPLDQVVAACVDLVRGSTTAR